MIPPSFDYVVPKTISEAVVALGENENARVLTGGRSLIPLMRFRLASPSVLETCDPVCGMTVEIASAHFISEYNGKTYYFCAAGCKHSFDNEPQKYIQAESSRM